ncbi:ATP-grasp domain-containing protein [Streptomyces sp. NBC_00483]|uniref:ATP-grasp domain-containing protein n=1 Tax=Streptomyces sp. NBC_00483 TaxID=2975756 RepID=UPI002E1989AA
MPACLPACLPACHAPHFAEAVLTMCRRYAVDVVVPTVGSELVALARAADSFAEAGVRVLVPSAEGLETCLDKWRLAEACEGRVRQPVTRLIGPAGVPGADFEGGFPAIAKPRTGSGSRGVTVVERPEDLARLPQDGTYLLQEMLPGTEYSVNVLTNADGRVVAAVPRARDKTDSGIVVAGSVLHDPELSALTEDTVTTFETQLARRRVVFDGFATVLAEEPGDLAGLWKQRLRWARGNVQVTRRYKDVWFRGRTARGDHHHRLGSFFFGLIWFSLLITPVLLVLCSASLLFLYLTDPDRAWPLFHLLWVTNLICYLLITFMSAVIDPDTFRRSWFEALIYSGAIATAILVITALPGIFMPLLERSGLLPQDDSIHPVMLAVYAWPALSMPIAWLAELLTGTRLRWLAPPLLHLAGYGSLLAACLVASFVQELRNKQMTWDKTEKTGKVAAGR